MDKKQLREWAQAVSQEGDSAGRMLADIDSVKAVADYIKETLPEPTMDEVEWDDAKHRFVVAKRDASIFDDPYDVLMLGKRANEDRIRCLDLETLQALDIFDDELTPTGERYIRQGADDE